MHLERGMLVMCRGIACVVIMASGFSATLSPIGSDTDDFLVNDIRGGEVRVVAPSPSVNRTQESFWLTRQNDWVKILIEKERLSR